MEVFGQSEEHSRFEALWEQYADLVYNLSIKLAGSAKQGWFLTRGTFLNARRKWQTLEGNTPSLWLTQIVLELWLTPYFEERTLWRRLFFKKKKRREMMLPTTLDAGLIFLSEEQDALLHCLEPLTYPQRLVAILQFGDGFSETEVARMAPFRERQIRKYSKAVADRFAQIQQDPSILKLWKPLKAPLTLKVDIMNRRVTLDRMEQVHIPNEYSLNPMVLLLVAAMLLLIASFVYYWHLSQKIPLVSNVF